MAKPFVSFDGTDKDGVRAEVYVQTGTGKITKIEQGGGGQSASVHVKGEGLKFASHGWIRTDDPIFSLIEEAHAAGQDINYRIESQRKAEVDRKTPISELRTSTDVARENTKIIFAGINGQLSQEAVTNPAEDPAPGGRLRAIDEKPAAPAAAAQPAVSVSRHAIEESPWKTHNTDGRVNLGSVVVQAAVGAETWSRKHLVEQGIISVEDFGSDDAENTVFRLAAAVLNIADTVQTTVYGGSPRPDRGANSHTRARSLIFDTVETYLPVPKSTTERSAWLRRVTEVVTTRFQRAVEIAFPAEPGASAPESAPAASSLRKEAPSAPAPAADPAPAPELEPEAPADVPEGLELFEVQGNTGEGERATPETIGLFKDFVGEAQVPDLKAVSALLRYTFGTNKAADVSDELLGEFVDFYVGNGEENFRDVCAYVYGLGA